MLAGLALSLVGDIALLWPQQGFLPGLVAFLLAHACYLVAFTRGVRFAARPLAFVAYALVADVVALAIMGTTAEYMTFSGVSESLWMIVGILSFAMADRGAHAPAEAERARAGPLVPARL